MPSQLNDGERYGIKTRQLQSSKEGRQNESNDEETKKKRRRKGDRTATNRSDDDLCSRRGHTQEAGMRTRKQNGRTHPHVNKKKG